MAKFTSAYQDAGTRPAPVLRMEQQVLSARTHEEAQTQLLYEIGLQQFRLYRLVVWVVAVWAALVILGVVIVLVSG